MSIGNLPLIARAVNAAMGGRRECGTSQQTATVIDGVALAEAWLDRQLRRGETEVFSVVADLTPDLAQVLLTRNPDNRGIRARVLEMQRDIEEGRWQMNGEPVIIATDGHLNDGQHRCEAVMNAGKAIKTLMVFGVARDTRYSVDTGSARTPGDMLQMRGIADANNVAAVAGYLWQIERYGRVPDSASVPSMRPTKQEMQETVVRMGERIQRSVSAVQRDGSLKVASYSQLVTMHVYLVEMTEDEPAVSAFMSALIRGDKRSNNDPVWVGRERLIEEKRKRHLWPAKAMEIVLRAWNMHRRNARTGKIQVMGEWPKVAR